MTTETEALIARYIDRVENILGEIAALNADLKEIGTAVKSDGLDYPLIKRLATIRLKDKVAAEAEKLNTLGLYARAAGMQLDMFVGASREPTGTESLAVLRANIGRLPPIPFDLDASPTPYDLDTGEVIEPAATEHHTASTVAERAIDSPAAAQGDDPGSPSRAPRTRGAGEGDRPMRAALPNPIPVAANACTPTVSIVWPTEPNTTAALSQGLTGSQPCEPSPDEVLAAAEAPLRRTQASQSERAPEPTPSREIGVTEDVPAFLRRTMQPAEAAE